MSTTAPRAEISRLFTDCLNQSHLLIAGATGSGKSVFENGLIHAALYDSPARRRFIMLDPKGTELDIYEPTPHCITYAHTPRECIQALQTARDIVNARFNYMRSQHLRKYDGGHIYIVIDELMYLLNSPDIKADAYRLLMDLLTIARASACHVIACTQNPTRDTLRPTIRCNFSARIALRTATKQDSRNIIDLPDCYSLPDPATAGAAYGYYRRGADTTLYKLPYVTDRQIEEIVNYWTRTAAPAY